MKPVLSKQRKIAAIVSAILVVGLAIGGTLAAFQSSQEHTIEFDDYGDVLIPGGTGHVDNDAQGNIDVYYENYGESDLFVRIRLLEYMEIGKDDAATPLVTGAKRNDKTTWTPHVPLASNETKCDKGFHEYYRFGMGNADCERYYVPTNPEAADASELKLSNKILTVSDQAAYDNKLKPVPAGKVYTASEWVTNGKKKGDFWVVDTDGWAYWANPLASKSATALLLNEVKKIKSPQDKSYYAVHEAFQATDSEKVGSMKAAAGATGKEILSLISGDNSGAKRDELKAEIVLAKAELAAAEAKPADYDATEVAKLKTALTNAEAVVANDASTDEQLEAAITALKAAMPLTIGNLVPEPKDPESEALGWLGYYVPPVYKGDDATLEADLGTHVVIWDDKIYEDVLHPVRYAQIPLDRLLKDSDLSGVTVKAVDPAFESFIVLEKNTITTSTTEKDKLCITFKWLPLTEEGTKKSNFKDGVTKMGKYEVELEDGDSTEFYYVITEVTLTTKDGKAHNVQCTFPFTGSSFFPDHIGEEWLDA